MHLSVLFSLLFPGILDHFIPLVISDGQKRQLAGLPSQPLAPLVSLYNATLNHLISTALTPKLRDLQWPPPEFAPSRNFSRDALLPPLHWNAPAYLERIGQCFSQLVLSSDCGGVPPSAKEEEEGEWSRQCARCMEFVGSLGGRSGEGKKQQALIPLYSRQASGS